MWTTIHGVKDVIIGKWQKLKTNNGKVFWTKEIEIRTDENECAEIITLHTHDSELVKRENGNMK